MGSVRLSVSIWNISLVYLTLTTLYRTSTCYETYYLEDLCGNDNLDIFLQSNGSSSAGLLRATRHTSYSLHMICRVKLLAPPGHGILLSIREIGFRTYLDGSCHDYLKILMSREPDIEGDILCQTSRNLDETRTYTSHVSKNQSNEMELLYHTGEDLDNKTRSGYLGFTLTFTAFEYGSCGGYQQFRCRNYRCIWSGLLCDGHNNCGDLSDEEAFGSSNCGYIGNGSLVLVITAVLILVIGFVSAIITLVCYQNVQRRRRNTRRLRRRTESLLPIIESLQEDAEDRSRAASYQTFRSTEMPTIKDFKSKQTPQSHASSEVHPSRSATIT